MEREYSIVPYAVHDGVPTFRDSEIAEWFARLEREDTLRKLFFDGTVIYAKDLIRLVKTPGVFFFTVWTEGKDPGSRVHGLGEEKKETEVEMAALFWLTDFIGNAAFLHHVIFKKFWGRESKRIGRHVLEFIFGVGNGDQKPLVGTLLGLTPVNNIPAVKYARAVGMKPAGRVPGIFYDVYDNSTVNGFLSYMTLETCIQTRKEA